MSSATIIEVTTRTGLRASALRYYEEAALLTPVARISGRRHYDDGVVDRLRVIGCAREAGFTIAELGELLRGEGEPARWRALAERKLEVEAPIEKAHATRRLLSETLRCDCIAVNECVAVLGRNRPDRGS